MCVCDGIFGALITKLEQKKKKNKWTHQYDRVRYASIISLLTFFRLAGCVLIIIFFFIFFFFILIFSILNTWTAPRTHNASTSAVSEEEEKKNKTKAKIFSYLFE